MLKLPKDAIEASLRNDDDKMVADLFDYLTKEHPHVVEAYPKGYLMMILHDTLRIARHFGIEDVVNLRAFADLRWRMAAGWYREPSLYAVLTTPGLSADEKFARLSDEDMADAWINAASTLDTAEDWRGHLWEAAP